MIKKTLFLLVSVALAGSASAESVFSNTSTRGSVDGTLTPPRILTPGFVIEGDTLKTVLLRVAGPALEDQGVANACVDPVLRLFDQRDTTTPMATNSEWGTAFNAAEIKTTAAEVGAFAFADDSLDAAILITLEPGVYTAQGSCNSSSGDVLVETYAVD